MPGQQSSPPPIDLLALLLCQGARACFALVCGPSRRQKSSPRCGCHASARNLQIGAPGTALVGGVANPVHKHVGKYLSRCGSVKTLEKGNL